MVTMGVVHEGLVFGGPMNEQHVAAEGSTMVAIMPPRSNWWANCIVPHPDDRSISHREVLYRWEWFVYGGDGWGCWVADGFPRHRITDALNMILGLSRLMSGM